MGAGRLLHTRAVSIHTHTMKTEEMRVQSRWRVDGETREYASWSAVPDAVAERMIERVCEANAGVVGYTADDARESLRGRMEEGVRYKVVIHVGDVRADGVGGTAVPPPHPLFTHTHTWQVRTRDGRYGGRQHHGGARDRWQRCSGIWREEAEATG